MRYVNKPILSLLIFVLGSPIASAQQCNDSDQDAATAGNNPYVRGSVTVVNSAGARTQHSDSCDASGRSLREFFCTSSGSVSSVMHQGPYGCFDGQLVKEKANTPSCFIDIVLAITPNSVPTNPSTLSILESNRTIDRLWWAAARERPQPNDHTVEVIVKDGAGTVLQTRYSSIGPEYYDKPATRGISRVTLPFVPNARSILFKVREAELAYTLPSHLLTCSRPLVPIGLSGTEGIQQCVPLGQKVSINPTTFTCIPAESPSLSPSTLGI